MVQIIRRIPWIAVGAAGAWLLDRNFGSQRESQETVEPIDAYMTGGR